MRYWLLIAGLLFTLLGVALFPPLAFLGVGMMLLGFFSWRFHRGYHGQEQAVPKKQSPTEKL